MQSIRLTTRASRGLFRHFSKCTTRLQNLEASSNVTENLTIPPPTNVDPAVSEKIEKLGSEISNLTLVEVTELSGYLKRKLNLPEAAAYPMGAFATALPGGFKKSEEDDNEEAPKAKKSSFTVKLTKFDEKQKIALIKEIKGLLEGMNLVQAKKFVESAPTIVKSDIPQDEAEKLKEILTKVGGVVEID